MLQCFVSLQKLFLNKRQKEGRDMELYITVTIMRMMEVKIMEQDSQHVSHPSLSSPLLLFSAHPRHIHRGLLLSICKALQSCHTSHPLSMFLLLKCIQLHIQLLQSVLEGHDMKPFDVPEHVQKDTHMSVIFPRAAV